MKNPIIAAFLLTTALSGAASAHEILVTPTQADGKLKVAIESTHVFVEPEELESAENIAASLQTADGKKDLTVTAGGELTLMTETEAPEGAAWFVAHRLPLVFSNTPTGYLAGGKDVNPDAESSSRFEKFTKALINGDQADEAFVTKPLGHVLEIVPMSNPAMLKAGDELEVQVLHNGQPVAATVQATFAGFSDKPMTFAYSTEATAEFGEPGMATVKLWSPGYWMVRAALELDDADEAVDEHVLRAILSFDVQ